MDWGVLIVAGVAVWLTVAAAIALLIGRMVRRREQQEPPPAREEHIREQDRWAA
jgi:hypothetical protein